jgi:hypothetical protein
VGVGRVDIIYMNVRAKYNEKRGLPEKEAGRGTETLPVNQPQPAIFHPTTQRKFLKPDQLFSSSDRFF